MNIEKNQTNETIATGVTVEHKSSSHVNAAESHHKSPREAQAAPALEQTRGSQVSSYSDLTEETVKAVEQVAVHSPSGQGTAGLRVSQNPLGSGLWACGTSEHPPGGRAALRRKS